MPLNPGQQKVNQEELDEVKALISSLYEGSVGFDAKQANLDDLLRQTADFLQKNDIIVTMRKGRDALQHLIIEALFAGRALDFQATLIRWMAQYKKAEQEDIQLMRTQMAQYTGIAHALMAGHRGEYDWGNDADIHFALKGVMVVPEEVKKAGVYILPPISLVSGSVASDIELRSPHIFLQGNIQTVLDANPTDRIELVVPVNSSQNHWLLARVQLNQGAVENATLWDPMHKDLAGSAVLENFKKAIESVKPMNTGATKPAIKVEAAPVQSNGYSCMDYTVQKALQVAMPVTALIEPRLSAIRDARDAKELRQAVTARIITHIPAIKAKPIQPEVRKIFEITPASENLEQTVFAALTQSKDQAIKEAQVKFDFLMSKKLNELYRRSPFSSDDELNKQARSYAFSETQKLFGIFTPEPKEKPTAPVVLHPVGLTKS